jgi:hypothetical protein
MIYEVKNIIYDTDGKKVDLPKTLEINVSDEICKEDIEDFISDEISNITGFCHLGFDFYLSITV